MRETAIILVNLFAFYWLIGAVFSIIFIWKGLSKVDDGSKGSSIWFKLLIFPGLCTFWPVFLTKWIKISKS